MKLSEVRSSFLEYFRDKGHEVVASSPLVPQADPTLLFTNAGMVQFKDVFIGLENMSYKRAASSQKCLRAGGKHNDLDQVGYTARHHTFFEMLGNFSFGDYFKEDAIAFAWDFITNRLEIPANRLLATVYHDDDEAIKIWKKVAGSNFTIIPIATSDNFWSMGDTGPCGPCSELFYDHGDGIFGGPPGSENQDGDRFVEIWNIVFMQFQQLKNGERIPLVNKSIDTGMGIERVTAVMQGEYDNYDIDLFQSIISDIQSVSGIEVSDKNRASFKVISDHIRALCFLLADGVFPSNEGRGYVLRRILRRAVRHANLIGAQDPILHKLVDNLVDNMGEAYPELVMAQSVISTTIKAEEERFFDTLENGLHLLNLELQKIPDGGTLNGEVAFKLYDTYGFPLDLTQDIVKNRKITVDEQGFAKAMEQQRQRSSWSSSYDKTDESIYYNLKENIEQQEFVGYEKYEVKARILSILRDGKILQEISDDGPAEIVLDKTVCYAESGGQVGDIGFIAGNNGGFSVEDTQNIAGVRIHRGNMKAGNLSIGDTVIVSIDSHNRLDTARHHTATHLLQAALRNVVGSHISQKGSYICGEYMRFDFSNNSPLNEVDISTIESLVNEWILANYSVQISYMSKEEAIKNGALALFGEKYSDEVRVISIIDDKGGAISSELCGGTHVSYTGQIGLFKIISESSIGAGLRRIEAKVGRVLIHFINKEMQVISEVSYQLKCSKNDILTKTKDLLDNNKILQNQIVELKQRIAIDNLEALEVIAGVYVQFCVLSDFTVKESRDIAEIISRKKPADVLVIFATAEDKVFVIIKISQKNQKDISAKSILDSLLSVIDGSGGGRSDLAQGGGVSPEKIPLCMEKVREHLKGSIQVINT